MKRVDNEKGRCYVETDLTALGSQEVNPLQCPDSGLWTFSTRQMVLLSAIVVWSGAMLALSVARDQRHDYVAYLEQWSLVLGGQDPWMTSNTYGPLHNVIGLTIVLHPLVPKLLIGMALTLVNFLLVSELLRSAPPVTSIAAYALFLPLNFLVVSVVFSFGLNDGLVASLVGLAILARLRKWFFACGVLLGLAVLLKYYPALLIPFFCLDRRRFSVRTLTASAITVATGFFFATALWGTGFVSALTTGAAREPKLLSVLAALEHTGFSVAYAEVFQILVRVNALMVVAAVVLTFISVYALRLRWIEGAALASLIYLLVYKVGHQQFYLTWIVLLIGLLIVNTRRSAWMAYSAIPAVVLLSVFQFGYEILTDEYREVGGIVRDNVGFAAFLIGWLTVAGMLVIAQVIDKTGKMAPNAVCDATV